MATLVDRAVAEVLAGERSVLAFEQELTAIFAVSEDEIIEVVRAFFQKHAKDGKISFAMLRRYLDAQAWHTFSLVLTDWQQEATGTEPRIRKSFADDIAKLLQRKKVTNLEELNMRVRYALEKRTIREEKAVYGLVAVNVLAAYYTRFYDMAQAGDRGVRFEKLSDADLQKLIEQRWGDSKTYGSFEDRIENNLDQLISEYEMVVQQAIAAGQNADAMAKLLSNRMRVALGRERGLTRTEVNRAMNSADMAAYKAADIEEYVFVAVLDEVTSDICRSLNGMTFRVSQAQEQVNFPPMHTNCRSTTEPVIDYSEFDEGLTNLSRTDSLEKFITDNYDGEYLEELLDFLHNRRK